MNNFMDYINYFYNKKVSNYVLILGVILLVLYIFVISYFMGVNVNTKSFFNYGPGLNNPISRGDLILLFCLFSLYLLCHFAFVHINSDLDIGGSKMMGLHADWENMGRARKPTDQGHE